MSPKLNRLVLHALIAAGLFGRISNAGQSVPYDAETARQEVQKELKPLSTKEPLPFMAAAGREGIRHDELVKILIKALDDDNDQRIKEHAALLLGRLRDNEAVRCLLAHLTEVRAGMRISMDPDLGEYPCALALVAIGKPAAEIVVESLEIYRIKEEDIHVAAHIIDRILGRDEAIKILQDRLQKMDPANREPLHQALQIVVMSVRR